MFPVIPWSTKHHKMAQPDMDYLAPEIQLGTAPFVTPSCDMFSLGMLICSVYNGGKSLIQASHNPVAYAKQIDRVSEVSREVSCTLSKLFCFDHVRC
jgi:SCY1-like protein 2